MSSTTSPKQALPDRHRSRGAVDSAPPRTHLLIGYDGSTGAQHAVRRASELFPGSPATVACIWESLLSFEIRHGGVAPGAVLGEGSSDLDVEASSARATALAGRDLALESGIDAQALSQQVSEPVWQALVRMADGLGPTVIVVGTRGLTGLRSVILGSVSRPLVERSHHPVLVIPSMSDEGPAPGGVSEPHDARVSLDEVPERESSETARLADRLIASWASADVDAFVAPFSSEATLEIGGQQPATGADRIREEAVKFFDFGRPTRVALTRRSSHIDADHATLTLGVTLSRVDGESVGPLTATVELQREGAQLSDVRISDFFGADPPV